MALDLWTPAELIEVQQDERAVPPDGFWSGQGVEGSGNPVASLGVFTREVRSETRKIYFDQLPIRDRRLAPFVAPNVQGRVMADRGRSMASFAPAYVKPKHVVTPDRAIARRPGEPIGIGVGGLSLEQRFDAIVAQNMADERAMIERRWDWMACQAIVYATVTISGEDYPTVTVDFKRDPSLTIILLTTARWHLGTATVMADIAAARTAAFTKGQSPINKLVFGVKAWGYFYQKTEVQALLSNQNRGSTSTFNSFSIGQSANYEYKGFIQGPDGGRLDMWVYSNQYEDDDGVMQEYLDPNDVVGLGDNVQGIRCYGAILDKRAGLQALPMFPKMWDSEDPSETFTMTQSAPLYVPGNPNNTFRLRVSDQ